MCQKGVLTRFKKGGIDMEQFVTCFFTGVGVFFLAYLLLYASYLFASVAVGAFRLYKLEKMSQIKNELKHEFYFPVSILVPAYNEEVTIIESVESLLNLNYKLYEIIVIDDGSADRTTEFMVEHFQMKKVSRPIRRVVECEMQEAVYECRARNIKITLIRKKNGGKGDALNMGINASEYPYFLCMDADSMLQDDSIERIVRPVMEDDNVVAVGGLIRVAQCVVMEHGEIAGYHLPWNILLSMQAMEYDRSFLASRILLDSFNGNLIISGAFGLFKKEVAVAVGGYDRHTLGEDMELVVKLHAFCRNNQMGYTIRYEPNAICWSQVPSSFRDLKSQRRRWHLGLFQCMWKYRRLCLNSQYGLLVTISYMYYLLYELCSPAIEIFGLFTILLAVLLGRLNVGFMLKLYLLYTVYGAVLTMTAFFQRIYSQNVKISAGDILKACLMCVAENVFFRLVLDFVRSTAFFGYRKRKLAWGKIKRTKL